VRKVGSARTVAMWILKAVSADIDHQWLGRLQTSSRLRNLELVDRTALVEWAVVPMKGLPGSCWKGE
jgi:hypothetical protein